MTGKAMLVFVRKHPFNLMWVSPPRCFAQRQKSKSKTGFAKSFIALPQKSHAIIFAISYWWYKLAIICYRKKLCRDLNKKGNVYWNNFGDWPSLSRPLSCSLTLIYPFIYQAIISPHQSCSVAKSCPTLPDPMDYSMPGFPVPHHLPEFAQVHVHCIGDAIQPSHPLLYSSLSAFNLSQQQHLLQWVGCSHQVDQVLELQLQHQFFEWVFRVDFL